MKDGISENGWISLSSTIASGRGKNET
jgi:hypothetical protein